MTSSRSRFLGHLRDWAIIFFSTLVLLEIACRACFWYPIGPDVLFWGLTSRRVIDQVPLAVYPKRYIGPEDYVAFLKGDPQSSNYHEHIQQGYTKYAPRADRVDWDIRTSSRIAVRINSRGFRGEEFSNERQEGVARVVCLGASSTFGFGSPDEDTYPRRLQSIASEVMKSGACGSRFRSVEVTNLGIPHLTSSNIVELFVNEALPLNPDVVTFYEGINDSAEIRIRFPPLATRLCWRLARLLENRLIVFRCVTAWIRTKQYHEKADVMSFSEANVRGFLTNLGRINSLCKKNGIRFLVMTQQSQPCTRKNLEGLSYEEEARLVWEKCEAASISWSEAVFLCHSQLMDNLRQWAYRNQVPLLDCIKVLNERRDTLFSWVHLTPEGNMMIASALAERVIAELCSTQSDDKR